MEVSKPSSYAKHPLTWVPSLFYTEALPYAIVNVMTLALYADMKISNAQIAFWTSLLSWPWVIKPLWSPFVDIIRTKRWWTLVMQLLLAISTAGAALMMNMPAFFTLTLIFFCIVAFASATHDVAADGYYMLELKVGDQAQYVGLRSTFYRAGVITIQGGLLVLVGELQHSMSDTSAWTITILIAAALLGILYLYHNWAMPIAVADQPKEVPASQIWDEFINTFVAFFKKPFVWGSIAFLLVYRLPEAFLIKMIVLFLKGPIEQGGLGLPNEKVGIIYGTVGVGMLLVGGIIGGFMVARYGLKKVFWLMVAAIHIPNAVFLFLSYAQPSDPYVIGAAVALEQLGYGIGFTAFMMYLILMAEGEFKTAHYAIGTGLMAAGMMIPGSFAGAVQEALGWHNFFWLVVVCMIPSFLVSALVYSRITPEFGKKTD